ncbi:matrixin family metalloprotease [Patescibacteria group bacterium]|nr:matrixin family metalloprotease [Patescibacteria group bacterium]
MLTRFTWPLILIAGVTSLGYGAAQLDLFAPSCDSPVEYRIGEFDTRFGISRAEFEDALSDAAAIWNEAAGKEVVVFAADAEMTVNLEYGVEQRTSQLGEVIDEEQAAYDAAKAEFDSLASQLSGAKRQYESYAAAFEKRVSDYEADVAYWNERGGAPPAEYAELQRTQRALNEQQETLNGYAAQVNTIIDQMNGQVDGLNTLAEAINVQVDVYNSRAHTDFDQGRYVVDENGTRITIREFTEGVELRRVLAHELGHALGFGHVEDPDAIMYSYNVGEELVLSEADLAELRTVCELD